MCWVLHAGLKAAAAGCSQLLPLSGCGLGRAESGSAPAQAMGVVAARFAAGGGAQAGAEALLRHARGARSRDDCSVVVLRFRGEAAGAAAST